MWGKSYTVSEVMERVVRDRPFFEKSGGGVTVSGGEPLAQPEFTLALLKALKESGCTQRSTPRLCVLCRRRAVLPYVDLFLLDLKHMDSATHRATVGVPNERILENARAIAAAGGRLQIRVPVIPRFNDSGEHFRALAQFVAALGEAVTVVQVLPYHAMGRAQMGTYQAGRTGSRGDCPVRREDRRVAGDPGRAWLNVQVH